MMISHLEPEGSLVRLRIAGELDSDGARALRPTLERLANGPAREVVLDMTAVTFLDGAGLGAVAYLFKRLAARGRRLAATGASGQPLMLLEELGLSDVLGLAETPRRRKSGLGRPLWRAPKDLARGQAA